MASNSFQCRLITPTAKVLDEAVVYASIPVWDGLMGVLPSRAPIVAKLGLGELHLQFADAGKAAGGSRSFLVEDGFMQMVSNRLTILASRAIPTEALVLNEAQAELSEAEGRRAPAGDRAALDRVTRDRERARAKVRLASGQRAI
ncbi:MAG: F0F1 ATP synthase subunit epsilon [Phycisphaerales bacterium]|nr:F0F1 ATP synthase subunit epsilon [Phycisphaerales bacterium]